MLLSILLIGIVVGLSIRVFFSFLARNDLDLTTQRISETLRRAQVYARGMNSDSAWSVEIQSTVVTLFKGTSFSGRNTNYDETVSIPGSLVGSGVSEVQFAKPSGLPSGAALPATITLTTNIGETKTVTI